MTIYPIVFSRHTEYHRGQCYHLYLFKHKNAYALVPTEDSSRHREYLMGSVRICTYSNPRMQMPRFQLKIFSPALNPLNITWDIARTCTYSNTRMRMPRFQLRIFSPAWNPLNITWDIIRTCTYSKTSMQMSWFQLKHFPQAHRIPQPVELSPVINSNTRMQMPWFQLKVFLPAHRIPQGVVLGPVLIQPEIMQICWIQKWFHPGTNIITGSCACSFTFNQENTGVECCIRT